MLLQEDVCVCELQFDLHFVMVIDNTWKYFNDNQ